MRDAGATIPRGWRWSRVIQAGVIVGTLGLGVAWLASSVGKARDAARASQTT